MQENLQIDIASMRTTPTLWRSPNQICAVSTSKRPAEHTATPRTALFL